jgi:VanZ family protein
MMLYPRTTFNLSHRATSAPALLLLAYTAAIVFLTLYPWIGWRGIPGEPWDFMTEAWPRYWTVYDVITNVLAYIPFGCLAAVVVAQPVHLRSSPQQILFTWLIATCLGSGLSFGLECLQSWLPHRVPSQLDWLTNSLGSAIGAALTVFATIWLKRGLLSQQIPQSSSWGLLPPRRLTLGAICLVLWIFSQASPQRLLFASGDMSDLFNLDFPTLTLVTSGWLEAFIVTGSMCIVTTVIWAATKNQLARRLALVITLTAAVVVKSTSARWLVSDAEPLWWLTAGAQAGLFLGAIAVSLLITLKPSTQSKIARALLLAIVIVVNFAPDNPYYESMIDRWDDGRWSSLHALFQSMTYLWPILAFIYLALARTAQRPRL